MREILSLPSRKKSAPMQTGWNTNNNWNEISIENGRSTVGLDPWTTPDCNSFAIASTRLGRFLTASYAGMGLKRCSTTSSTITAPKTEAHFGARASKLTATFDMKAMIIFARFDGGSRWPTQLTFLSFEIERLQASAATSARFSYPSMGLHVSVLSR